MPYPEALESAAFRSWLIRTLEPICEADPDVMADYVLALLKHEAPEDELKKFFVKELNDFLEEKSAEFVELLFRTLQTKGYEPGASAPTVATAPIVVDSFQPTKRRLSSPSAGPGPSSKAARRSLSPRRNEVESNAVPAEGKKKCFDYHERGFCARGVTCPFEHSPDSIYPVPGQNFPMPQFPMPMPMRGRGRGRGFGRGMPFPHFNGPGPEYNPNEQGMPPMPFFPGQQIPQDVFPAGTSGTQQPPSDRNGVTLLVSDIPYAHLSLESIVNYFKKFGTVTNVAIEGKSKRALVSFSTNREAYVAWRSDEAVFGSRHVKVLWHRPMKGQAAAGLEALEKSAPLLENLRRIEAEGAQAAQAGVKAKLSGPSSKLEQKLKQERELQQRVHLERLIAEQKVLLVRIEKEDKAERKALMARCKEIEVEMQKVKDGVEEEPVQAPAEDSHPTAKEKLDAELAALGMQTKDEETMALQKKLDDLKAQALTMGIDPTAPASPAPARGAWRGRARGRGRGRGGFAGPMRLDNRSRVVEVGGDGVAENKAAVQQWYESTGGEVGENDGALTVSYPSRELAEKALALGTKIPSVTAPVTVKWSQSRAPASAPEPVVERDERRTEREMDDEMQS